MAPEPQTCGGRKLDQTVTGNDEVTALLSSMDKCDKEHVTSSPEVENVTSSPEVENMTSSPEVENVTSSPEMETNAEHTILEENHIEDTSQACFLDQVQICDNDEQDFDCPIPDFDEPTPPLPPDGGYGWVIVFCGFMVNLLVDGMCYMGGMLFIELLDYFSEPKGKTQWVTTLVPAVYLMTGPFVGALVNKFGCRPITIVGSLLAAGFFIISSLAPNVEMLIGTYGVMIGIGFGLMYLPAVCFVSYYFDKRRAMATGISVCGSGIGTFIFPPFMNILLETYGWRGSLMIMAGLSLNCCVFGALLRPLTISRPKPKELKKEKKKSKRQKMEKAEEAKKSKRQKKMEKAEEARVCVIMQKIAEQKERNRTITGNDSMDDVVITDTNELVKDPELLRRTMEIESNNKLTNNPVMNSSSPNLSQLGRGATSEHFFANFEGSCSVRGSRTDLNNQNYHGQAPVNKLLEKVKTNAGSNVRKRNTASPAGSHNSLNYTGSTTSVAEFERIQRDMTRVMYRKDIFYTGSVTSIAEFKSSHDMEDYVKSVVSIPNGLGDAQGNCAPFVNILFQMFDLSLLKSVTFIVLMCNAFFSFLGFFVPFMFVPDLAKIMGASGREAALLISILGACNTFGRLAAGWLADRPWADCMVIQNVALITGGLATSLVPFLNTYALLAIYCAVFGTCMAMFIALRSIVTAELMGIEKLNNAFGLTIFFQGVAGTAGSPLAGTIFDATGSYAISFIIAGAFIAFSGVICLPLRRISRWENGKTRSFLDHDVEAEYDVVATDDDDIIRNGGRKAKDVNFEANGDDVGSMQNDTNIS